VHARRHPHGVRLELRLARGPAEDPRHGHGGGTHRVDGPDGGRARRRLGPIAVDEYTHDMAKKTITILTDDLDGEELPAGSRSTRFALDGVEYEIDLSATNARALADALAPYIAAGRRVGGAR